MPTVEKTSGNHVLIRGVGRFDRGDQADVSEETATYLTENRGDFTIVDDTGEPIADETDSNTGDDEAGFDADEWLEQDFGDRAEQVRSGDVDEHLDAIDDAETSDTVRDAIGERRAELEA